MTYNLLKYCVRTVGIGYHQFLRSTARLMSMDEEKRSGSWRGVPLSEIIGSQSPWGSPEFPLVTPSPNHTVLYEVPVNGVLGYKPPVPVVAPDKWDSEHVRLPCSPKSLYPCEENGEMVLKRRWPMIERALNQPIRNSYELADAILTYNTKFEKIWNFRALHALFNDHLDPDISEFFFMVTMPLIAKLALKLPKLVQAPIPLLKQHKNHSISLSQQQIACLMANAFFCTFPRRNTTKRNSEYSTYPHINFSSLYESPPDRDVLEKITCLCNYLRHASTKAPRGTATFIRRSVPPRGRPDWPQSRAEIAALPIHVDSNGHIEDVDGLIQLDFANKYLGGGVLGHGCVQEEIRFVICPELMISMLFTELLRPNEAFFMIGCQRYNKYKGYGRSFRWDGDFSDHTPRDSSGRKRVAVLAIDALPYSDGDRQYCKEMITRELNKAWVGFSFFTDPTDPSLKHPGLATGNWGCGAFRGSPELKSLIQLMAAAETRRPLAYFTFEDTALRDQIINTYNLLARYNVTVGQLYQYIMRFSDSDVPRAQLHAFLHQTILDEHKQGSTLHMDISTPPAETSNEPKDLKEDSPDLFSIEEDMPSTSTSTPSHSHTDTKDNTQTKPKENTIPPQTKRLFDELQKFDEESGSLNLITPLKKETKSKYFDSQTLSEDLFKSSDSETEQNDVSMTISAENTPKTNMAAGDNKMADSETKMADIDTKMVDSETKMADIDTKMVDSETKMADIDTKMADSETKMADIDTKMADIDTKMAGSDTKMAGSDTKMADSEKKMVDDENKMAASTSRLFDEMQKFDEEHGRLNLNVPSTSHLLDTTNDSMVIENEKVEVTSEVKKKITKKITDYFSKKPT